MKNEIRTIRPRQIFKIVEDRYPDANIELTITMPPSGIGSLLTVESSLLVALTKITNAKRIFDIGTFNGNTSLLLATNTPRDAIITTLDLPPDEIELHEENKLNLADADQNDQHLRQVFKNKGAFYIKRASADIQSKIKVIHQNSHDFEPSANGLCAKQDIVFVDGGHDYSTIKNDTEKALRMLKPNGVIIWHDYLSKIHTEVELYLRDFSIDKEVIAIGSTMLCFYPQGDFAGIFK